MAIAHVGSTANHQTTATAASDQMNLAQPATNGNMLVVVAFCAGGASAPTITITDSTGGSNTWTAAVSVSNGVGYNGRFVIAYARNIAGAPTWVKVTPSVSSFIAVIADEYSGVDNAATPQTSNSGVAQGPSTPAIASSITPTNAGSLAYFAEGNDGANAETVTASGVYVRRGNLTNTAGFPAGSADNVSATTAQNPSIAFGANENWQAGLVIFAPAATSSVTADMWFCPLPQPSRARVEMVGY